MAKAQSFSPNGDRLVIQSSEPHNAEIFHLADPKRPVLLNGHAATITKAIFGGMNGSVVATCSLWEGWIGIWNPTNGDLIRDLFLGESRVTDIEFAPDGKTLLSANSDGKVCIWNIENGRLRSSINNDGHSMKSVTFNENASSILGITDGGIAIVWDTASGEQLYSSKSSGFVAECGDIHPFLHQVCLGLSNTDIMVVDFRDQISGEMLEQHNNSVTSVQYDQRGHSILSCAGIEPCLIFDLESLDLKAELGKEITFYTNVSIGNHGKLAAFSSVHGHAMIADLSKGHIYHRFSSPNRFYSLGTIHPTQNLTAIVSTDRYLQDYQIELWDMDTGSRGFRVLHHGETISNLKFSAQGTYLASCSHDGSVRVWKTNSEKEILSEGFSFQKFNSVSFDVNEEYIMACHSSGAIVWHVASGTRIQEFEGFWNAEPQAIFSSDASTVIMSSWDKLSSWDLVTGKLIKEINAHSNCITDIENGEDGIFTTTSWDGTVKVWREKNLTNILDLSLTAPATSVSHLHNGLGTIVTTEDDKIICFEPLSGDELFKMIDVEITDLITILPDRSFTSSKKTASKLHYVSGIETIGMAQMDVRFNRPDLVFQRLGELQEQVDSNLITAHFAAWERRLKKLGVDDSHFSDDIKLPQIEMEVAKYNADTDPNNAAIGIKLVENIEPLDKLHIWVNGVPVYGRGGKSITDSLLEQGDVAISLPLNSGSNQIEASVINNQGIECIRETSTIYRSTGEQSPQKIFFIGLGIDKYSKPEHDLLWSTKDIRDLLSSLKGKFGRDLVVVDTLLNDRLTSHNVSLLKNELLKSTESDKVIIMYSGHGILSEDYQYFLSTSEVDFKKPENGGIPYETLEWLLDSIPAREKLMLVDACHSGEIDIDTTVQVENSIPDVIYNSDKNESYTKKSIVPIGDSSPKTGLDNRYELMNHLFANVHRGTGATIISASGGTESAIESDMYQNGLFTYSILELMNERTSITVNELKQAVESRVFDLSKGFQRPTSRTATVDHDWRVW
jgi:WD40 repeat protein